MSGLATQEVTSIHGDILDSVPNRPSFGILGELFIKDKLTIYSFKINDI